MSRRRSRRRIGASASTITSRESRTSANATPAERCLPSSSRRNARRTRPRTNHSENAPRRPIQIAGTTSSHRIARGVTPRRHNSSTADATPRPSPRALTVSNAASTHATRPRARTQAARGKRILPYRYASPYSSGASMAPPSPNGSLATLEKRSASEGRSASRPAVAACRAKIAPANDAAATPAPTAVRRISGGRGGLTRARPVPPGPGRAPTFPPKVARIHPRRHRSHGTDRRRGTKAGRAAMGHLTPRVAAGASCPRTDASRRRRHQWTTPVM